MVSVYKGRMKTWASVWHLSRVECWSKCSTNLSFTRDDQIQRWCALKSLHLTMCVWDICDISSWVTCYIRLCVIRLKLRFSLGTKKSNSRSPGGALSHRGQPKTLCWPSDNTLTNPQSEIVEQSARPFLTDFKKSGLKSANENWTTCHVFNTQTSNTTTAQA